MKDFDIRLRKRHTECDITIYSLPYRSGTTAFNRLTVSCSIDPGIIEGYLRAHTGVELKANIERAIEKLYARADGIVKVNADASATIGVFEYPDEVGIGLSSSIDQPPMVVAVEHVDAETVFAAEITRAIARVFGKGVGSAVRLRQSVGVPRIQSYVGDALVGVAIGAELTGGRLGSNAGESATGMSLACIAVPSSGRLRLLSDLDPETLVATDDTALTTLDYILLDMDDKGADE